MARVCTICRHPQRKAINAALISQQPVRDIASEFKLSSSAVDRHRQEHLPASMVKAKQASEVVEASTLVAQLEQLGKDTRAVLELAKTTQDSATMLRAIARLEKQLELHARLVGELSDAPQVGIVLSPEWVSVRAVILRALDCHDQDPDGHESGAKHQ